MNTHRSNFAFIKTTLAQVLTASALALPGAAVWAQAAPREAPAQAGHHMQPHDPAKMQARMEKRQSELKAKLKITPAQEPAWSAFTSAIKPPARPAAPPAEERAAIAKLPTPERIDKMRALRSQHMADMTARMDQVGNATKTFYGALSPEQQKVFDAEAMQRSGRHHGGHGGQPGAGMRG
jgi:periplasmic protein CpxP/Spy